MAFEHRIAAMQEAIGNDRLSFSAHALDEMFVDRIVASDVRVALLGSVELIEDYPTYHKGSCCLVLCWIAGEPIHAVVSYPPDITVVTVYRPDRARWSDDFRRRLPRP
jgi:hypothetical protein